MIYVQQFLFGVCFGGGLIAANAIAHKVFGVGIC